MVLAASRQCLAVVLSVATAGTTLSILPIPSLYSNAHGLGASFVGSPRYRRTEEERHHNQSRKQPSLANEGTECEEVGAPPFRDSKGTTKSGLTFSPRKEGKCFSTQDLTLVSNRRAVLKRAASPLVMSAFVTKGVGIHSSAQAAPPISVLAEELGYFPVTNDKGDTLYVPAPIQRSSTEQAVALARHLLQNRQALMYGAYWCPHCRHQRELWGREAFSMIPYVECSSKGFAFRKACPSVVEGFPTWAFFPPKRSSPIIRGGEVSLTTIAQLSGYEGPWDEELERATAPAPIGGAAC